MRWMVRRKLSVLRAKCGIRLSVRLGIRKTSQCARKNLSVPRIAGRLLCGGHRKSGISLRANPVHRVKPVRPESLAKNVRRAKPAPPAQNAHPALKSRPRRAALTRLRPLTMANGTAPCPAS